MGEERFKKELLLFKSISEAFGAVKEIKMGGLEQIYIKRFSDPARTIAKNLASSSVVQQFPRFALEAVAFGGIMLLILFQMINILQSEKKCFFIKEGQQLKKKFL